jgi:hypothetical protein
MVVSVTVLLGLTAFRGPVQVAHAAGDDLAGQLFELDATVLSADAGPTEQLARARMREANQRESRAWRQTQTRADWEQYRDARLQALRASLGTFTPVPRDLKTRVTRLLETEGENPGAAAQWLLTQLQGP